MQARPYYMKNKEWYTTDKNGEGHLTDKAPKKARDSFIEWNGSDDPKKRSIFYFLSNPKWYTVDWNFYKNRREELSGRAFHLTEEAPPEAVWSYEQYYARAGFTKTGKRYFMKNRRWYTKNKDGEYKLTDEATPAAKGSYLEYKYGVSDIIK